MRVVGGVGKEKEKESEVEAALWRERVGKAEGQVKTGKAPSVLCMERICLTGGLAGWIDRGRR